ncbi:MAG: DUF3783 domain-containing protein [Firmicutes bacterium]|nr:DUF3783 domain-containing protein [Bacillota bacterium]
MDLNFDMQPTVLLYNMQTSERGEKIRAYLTKTGVKVVDVLPADFRQPIGALAGVPGYERTSDIHMGAGFTDEMLIMHMFDDMRMNAFFAFFRQAGLQSVDLKAVVTPTNAEWNSIDLHDEISKEHAMMHGQNR